MYNRAKKTSSSVWLVHPDVHQQLDLMSFAVGTGGVPYLSARIHDRDHSVNEGFACY